MMCQAVDGRNVPDFSPSPTRLLYALRRAHLAVEARKERALKELGILPAHYAVLINVWAHPGVTGAELARHLGVSPQNVAGLVAKLVARGLLHRTPHPRHGHVLEVHLTPAGQDVLRSADTRVAHLETVAVEVLGRDAETATRSLDALARGL